MYEYNEPAQSGYNQSAFMYERGQVFHMARFQYLECS